MLPSMLPNISSAIFGRKRIQPSSTEEDGTENSQNVNTQFLEELQDSISRIANLVKQCNIAWSVETGAYLFPDKAARKLNNSNISNGKGKSAGKGYNAHSCRFMPFDSAVEKEMVELLRRTAELVVYGERNNQDLFQYFCERNVLAIIVDILTGLAFATENTMGCTMLPPLSVATQGVQSMAILIQNVSNVQSLYLLLANERLADLIKLPLEMYQSCSGHDDADISELSTNFVSFLKSLAMRMNSETLQFFLTFPEERRQSLTASAAHFSLDDDDNDIRVMPAMVEVEFPLYARALEFCTASQDSFVRTTAMNICLNTLRLVVAEHNHEDRSESNGTCPIGSLEQVTLSFRDRLIIAHHVCAPERVSALITPISTIIAQLCGWLEDSIRAFEGFAGYMGRDRLRNKVRDTVIDLQEEIVLLDDILKVGISSLNEQAIEMLLATAIYPVLLQPLLFQKKSSSPTYAVDDILNQEDCEDATGLSSQFNASINPFSVDDPTSELFLSSGLRNDFENKQQPGNQQQHANKLQSVILTVPAKSSLVGLITILGSLSNKTFIRMIVTCLFHPFSPDSKEGEAFVTTPNMVEVQENGKLSIRLDSKTDDSAICYDFGRYRSGIDENVLKQKKKKGETCVFVLAPAIADIIDKRYNSIKTRMNPYRKVLMSGLSGSYYDDDIQPFFVLLVDTAITAMGGSFGEVAFPHDSFDESLTSNLMKRRSDNSGIEDDDSFTSCHSDLVNLTIENAKEENAHGCSNELVEFCECLPRSVMTAPLIISGVWKLFFDDVAANALLALDKKYKPVRKIAVDVLKFRMSQAASYLSQIACAYIVDSTLGSHDEDDLTEEEQEERINLFTDELFSNPIDDEGSLIDTLSFNFKNDAPNFSILLTSPSGTDRVVQLACGDFFVPGEFVEVLQDDRHTRICTITSLLSLIQLDAMLYLLRDADDLSDNNEAISTKHTFKQLDLGVGVEDEAGSTYIDDSFASESVHAGFYGASTRKALKKNAPLSPSLCSILYYERGTSEAVSHHQEGAVVSFVGKTALPCVCEVPDNFCATVKGVGSFVETNGVRWQSLYMVLLVNVMVLVVPAKGTTGNGRIISCCRISGLSVMKDDAAKSGKDRKSNNPARRLCLTYETLETFPPGLFTTQEDNSALKKKRVVHTSYLDLWFQKQSSVDFAYATLQSKIKKARSKRGKVLRNHLNHLATNP